jgi:hypothetical protein
MLVLGGGVRAAAARRIYAAAQSHANRSLGIASASAGSAARWTGCSNYTVEGAGEIAALACFSAACALQRAGSG